MNRDDNSKRYPPRHKPPPVPPGQDFDTMVAAHGRPRGPFEFGWSPRRTPAAQPAHVSRETDDGEMPF